MNNVTCCFTGHRNISKYNLEKLKVELENAIEELISYGVVNFEAGGALGFDTIAALTVLKVKEKIPQIKLILVLPCINQADKWNESDVETYEYIKSQSDECFYTSEDYNKGCMLKRNRYMVDHAEYVISAWDGRKSGGTYATVNYARKLNRKIINLNLS